MGTWSMWTPTFSGVILFAGVFVILFSVFSKRVDTRCFELGLFFNLMMLAWIMLFWSDIANPDLPTWQTVTARLLILISTIMIIKKVWRKKRIKL